MRISDWSSDVCSSDLLSVGDYVDGWHEFGHAPAVLIFMPAIDIITHRQQEQTVIPAALPVAGRDLAQPPECRPRLVPPVRPGESIGEGLLRRGKVGPKCQGLTDTSERHVSIIRFEHLAYPPCQCANITRDQ